LILNIVRPVTHIASYTCSTRGHKRCHFRYPGNELSPLFWQTTDVNMWKKPSWKCTSMLKPLNKLHLWTPQYLKVRINHVYIYFQISNHSRLFWKSMYILFVCRLHWAQKQPTWLWGTVKL
jgi:hypothetical protein